MLFFFPRSVLDGILNLIESVSEGFPSYINKTVVYFRIFYFISRRSIDAICNLNAFLLLQRLQYLFPYTKDPYLM